jgi:predicted metal-binding membrane protein
MQWLRKNGRAILIVSVALFALLEVLALIWVPQWQVASLRAAKGVELKDVFKAENDARATLAQILGGLTVLVGLYFAWANLKATQDAQQDTQNIQAEILKNQAETLHITNEGQIADRFTSY